MEKESISKNIPWVLQQRILFTALIGAGCLAVGIAYFLFSRDMVFLALSGLVFLFSLLRGIGLWHTIMQRHYEVVEGTCIGISAKPLRQQSKVRIMDESGVETALRLGKQPKIKIGFRYRFYFKRDKRLSVGSEYFDTALSTDQFLGFEELGKFEFQPKENN